MKKLYSTIVLSLFAALGATAQVNIGETAYTSLQEAVNAATDGQTITITSDVKIDDRITVSGKTITIAAENDAKIIVTKNFNKTRILFNQSANVTLENVTVDCNNIESDRTVIEIENGAAGATLRNVSILNANQTAGRSILVKRATVFENLAFENCTFADGVNPVLVGNNNVLTVKGTGNYNMGIESTYRFTTDNFTGKIGLTLLSWTPRQVVTAGNVANFELVNAPEGYTLMQDGEGVSTSLVKNIVTNETTGESFTSFDAAFAAAASGDELTILEDIEVAGRILCGSKNITIAGATPEVSITCTNSNTKQIFFEIDNNRTLTVKNITVDINNRCDGFNAFNIKGNVTLENVTIKNASKTSNIIALTNAGRTARLTDVTAVDCGEKTLVNLSANSTIYYNGDNNIGARLAAGATAAVAEDGTLTNTTPLQLVFADAYTPTADAVVVKNCTDAAKFDLVAADWHLEAKDGNLVLAEGETTGIDAIVADENAPVEYYNLQGIRVAEPSNGIFIRRQGNKTTKVAF